MKKHKNLPLNYQIALHIGEKKTVALKKIKNFEIELYKSKRCYSTSFYKPISKLFKI